MESSSAVVRSGADSPRLLGQINDQIVLGLLLDHGPMTRAKIGELTGLSKPTVSALLERLASRGLIAEAGLISGGPGPRAQTYQVNAGAGHVVAIHVEQHGSVAALATLTGDVIATHSVPVPQRRESNPQDEARSAVDGVIAAAGLTRADINQIVVATPGVIDPVTGALRHGRHLHGWEAPGLREAIEHDLGIPISHGNDVNLASVAEGLQGAARGHRDYAVLWLGRGVGLGVVSDGSLRTGAHGGAGEIGYLPAPGLQAPRIDRGATGAFQQLVGGQGITALAKQHHISGNEPAEIVGNAAQGSDTGERFLSEFATRVASGVAAIATILDPGIIVLGGPVALAGGDDLISLINGHMKHVAFVRPPVVLTEISDQGVITGAIEVALQDVRSRLFGHSMTGVLR